MKFKHITNSLEDYIINIRRDFHKYPELSWEEVRTSDKILVELNKIGIKGKKIVKTGVLGVLNPEKEGKVLAIRADIDALPVIEENNLDFKSCNNGVMHACGHDAHAAMLLGAAKAMYEIKDELGKVVFLFQPAEEFIKDSGAKHVVEGKFLEREKVDRILAIHIWNSIKSGKVALQEGAIMASADTYKIEIIGKGGHGAQPNLTIDPIPIGCMVVENLQHLVSRVNAPINPMVVSITSFNSGNSANIIPDKAELLGTCRTFDNKLREYIPSMMEKIVKGICEANGAEYKFNYYMGTPATINETESVNLGREVIADIIGEENIIYQDPQMGGEDFAKYLVSIPGCLMFLGGNNGSSNAPHHNSKFMISEEVLKIGSEYFSEYAYRYFNK